MIESHVFRESYYQKFNETSINDQSDLIFLSPFSLHHSAMQTNPESVLCHKKPSKGFLCPLSANGYGINFQSFSIKNHETKANLFNTDTAGCMDIEMDPSDSDENVFRRIRYTFPAEVLNIPRMETS